MPISRRYHARVTAVRSLVLALGVAMGAILPFVSVILASFGFAPGQIGLLASLGAVAFTIAVPAWGHLADVRLGRPRTFQICALGSLGALILLLGTWPMVVVAGLFLWFWVFQSAWQPLVDAITVNALGDRGRGYARVRLLSSLSFALASIIAGFVYDRTGYVAAFVICGVAVVLMVISAAGIRDVRRANLGTHRASTSPADAAGGSSPVIRTWRFGSAGVALRLAPRLRLVLLAVGHVHVGMLSGYTFLPLYLTNLGGQPSDVALSAGVSALAEIPSMLVMGRVVERVGLRAVFVGGALLYAATFASWTVIAAPELIIATRLFTGIAFASVLVSVVLTIARLLPPELQATGQALFQTTAFGIAAIVSNLIGGLLYATIGPAAVFGLGSVLAIVAALVGWSAFPPRDRGLAGLPGGPSVRQSPS